MVRKRWFWMPGKLNIIRQLNVERMM